MLKSRSNALSRDNQRPTYVRKSVDWLFHCHLIRALYFDVQTKTRHNNLVDNQINSFCNDKLLETNTCVTVWLQTLHFWSPVLQKWSTYTKFKSRWTSAPSSSSSDLGDTQVQSRASSIMVHYQMAGCRSGCNTETQVQFLFDVKIKRDNEWIAIFIETANAAVELCLTANGVWNKTLRYRSQQERNPAESNARKQYNSIIQKSSYLFLLKCWSLLLCIPPTTNQPFALKADAVLTTHGALLLAAKIRLKSSSPLMVQNVVNKKA